MKIKLVAFAFCIALAALQPTAVIGQERPNTTAQSDNDDDDDDDFDYGWIGLIGLAGLLGLRKRDRDVHVHEDRSNPNVRR